MCVDTQHTTPPYTHTSLLTLAFVKKWMMWEEEEEEEEHQLFVIVVV